MPEFREMLRPEDADKLRTYADLAEKTLHGAATVEEGEGED